MNDIDLKRYINLYHKMVFKVAYNMTLDYSDSEDIVQESFLKLYTSNIDFAEENDVKAWLLRVAINLSKNRNKLFHNRMKSEMKEDIYDECISEDKIALKAALEQLPQKYRIVIHLYYFEGYQSSEISKILGISVSSVTTRLQRGREKLKNYLE